MGMKIALAQINTTVGDFEGNGSKILDCIEEAKRKEASMIIFPELAISGYPVRDLVERPSFLQQNEEALLHIAKSTEGIAAIVGSITKPNHATPLNKPYNSAVLLKNGRIEFIQPKELLPTYDVFDEHRNFQTGDTPHPVTLQRNRFGITICEDIWNSHRFWKDHKQIDPYQIDPVTELVRQGAEIIINISASPFHVGKLKIRHELVRDIALEHDVPVLYVNAVGGNDHLIFDGHSFVCDRHGQVVAQAKGYEEDIIYYDTVAGTGQFHEYNGYDEMQEMFNALVLGTKDYVYKCGFKQAVIGLSGGIDSAVTAAIAVAALGEDNVVGLTMPSEYSSKGSVDDSVVLAKNLGIKLYEVAIQPTKNSFVNGLGDCWSHDSRLPLSGLNYGPDELKITGVADENLQARIRGTMLMTYSNQFGALVLTTGNKSELAVGYCTLYGDMNGGLAVISDVPKTKVYELAHWINSHWRSCIPQNTIVKPPSAELAPGQTDQQSLPPYDMLDQILLDYVEYNHSAETIANDYGYELAMVAKVIRLVERNEYKRQQAALGLKVSPKAFGIGRRYPIARRF